MKRSMAIVLFVAFLETFVSCGQGERLPVDPDPMERVENGLFLGAPVVGVPGASLEERMAAFNVPGVSIAVIHDYEIVAVKAYLLKQVLLALYTMLLMLLLIPRGLIILSWKIY